MAGAPLRNSGQLRRETSYTLRCTLWVDLSAFDRGGFVKLETMPVPNPIGEIFGDLLGTLHALFTRRVPPIIKPFQLDMVVPVIGAKQQDNREEFHGLLLPV